MPFTDSAAKGLLDYFIATYAATTKYFGVSSTTPTRAGANITEPSTGSYARVAATAADWAAATGSAPSTKTTSAAKAFPAATADWLAGANLTYWVLFDASTSGNAIAYGLLTTPKPVLNGDTPSFGIGAVVMELGASGDTF